MTDARLGKLVRTAALLTAVWTVPVVIGTAAHRFGMMGEGDMPVSHIIGNSFALWYVWIPASLAIVFAYRTLPFTSRLWPLAIVTHLAILVSVFFAQVWLAVNIGHVTGHIRGMDVWGHAQMMAVDLTLYDLFIYGGVLAVAYGLESSKRFRDRDLRASQLETQLERTRLEALQMQLQPHFLFNALNSIAMLVRRERKQEALDTVIGFSEMLRYVLDEAGTIDVPLGEEIQFVRRYLEIEQIRYGARLRNLLVVSRDAERAVVPNLLLQPLVENALKHGIAHLPDGGEIRISAERRGAVLRVEVVNDGPPLADGFRLDAADGLGLRNLRDRLAALIGDAATLELRTTGDRRGVIAVVEIPYRQAELSTARTTAHAPIEQAG